MNRRVVPCVDWHIQVPKARLTKQICNMRMLHLGKHSWILDSMVSSIWKKVTQLPLGHLHKCLTYGTDGLLHLGSGVFIKLEQGMKPVVEWCTKQGGDSLHEGRWAIIGPFFQLPEVQQAWRTLRISFFPRTTAASMAPWLCKRALQELLQKCSLLHWWHLAERSPVSDSLLACSPAGSWWCPSCAGEYGQLMMSILCWRIRTADDVHPVLENTDSSNEDAVESVVLVAGNGRLQLHHAAVGQPQVSTATLLVSCWPQHLTGHSDVPHSCNFSAAEPVKYSIHHYFIAINK